MRPNLTPQQAKLYSIIVLAYEAGKSPTFFELGKELGVAKVTAHEHVGELIKKGYLEKDKYKSRGVVPVEPIEGRYIVGRSDLEQACSRVEYQAMKLIEKYGVDKEDGDQMLLSMKTLKAVARV
jgi:predicted transcriptional regulator